MSVIGASNRIAQWAGIAVIAATAMAVSIGDADARKTHRVHHKARHVIHRAAPPFSYIVMATKSGDVLAAENANAHRYPASLTKVMTLYLLFEQLEAGKLRLDSRLKVSRHAASRPPSKLGLAPGSTIRVDQAIKAVVTRSANDVAVVIGEALAGSESAFARRMTETAHSLGMSRTVYRNASGLPNSQQVTTARDQALLGRAIQTRFPHYYRFFSTSRFSFRGHTIPNHNHLLGTVEGVDGIKTGYTQASGYNLLSSVHRNNHRLVAVVLGGRSWRTRDAFMRHLIERHIAEAGPKPEHTVAVSKASKPEAGPVTTVSTATTVPAAEKATLAAPAAAAVETAKIAKVDASFAAAANGVSAESTPAPVASKLAELVPAVAPTNAPLVKVSEPGDMMPSHATPVRIASTAKPAATAVAPVAAPARVKKVSAKVSTAKLVDSSALPLSLAVMLVAFSGIAGSFLSGSLTLLRRYLPRRSKLA